MHLRSLFLSGALALGANAFVVPEFEGEELFPPKDFVELHPEQALHSQLIDLECTECPFREAGEDGNVSWTDGFETSLALNFSVEDGFLLANGHQIFPPPPATRVNAVQRRESDGEETVPVPLGYALEMMPLAPPPEEPGMELLTVRFTVLDLDGHPVPLDTVAITLVHNLEGDLFLAKTDIEETIAPNSGSWKQCRGKPNCLRKLLFDRMRSLLSSAKDRMMNMGTRVSRPKGCHGGHRMKPSHHGHHGPGPFPFSLDGQPGGPGPHRHHHMHHGGLERTISRVVRFIVIPAILGVLAGLAASALGMLVGQVVVFLWLRYRRGGSQQPANVERGTVSEKEGLMTDVSDELPYSDEDDELPNDTKN